MKHSLFAVLLAALLVSGCGGGSSSPTPPPSDKTPQTAPTTPPVVGPPSAAQPIPPTAVPESAGQPAVPGTTDAGSPGEPAVPGSPGQPADTGSIGQQIVTVTAGDIVGAGTGLSGASTTGRLPSPTGGLQTGGTTTGETGTERVEVDISSTSIGGRTSAGFGGTGGRRTEQTETLSVDPNVVVILRDTEDPRAIRVLFKSSGDPTLGGSGVAMDLSDSANIISKIVIAADTSEGDGRCVQHAEGQRPATITSQSGTVADYTVGDIPDNGVILTLAQSAASLINARKYCLIIDDPNHYIKSAGGYVLQPTSVTIPFTVPDLYKLDITDVSAGKGTDGVLDQIKVTFSHAVSQESLSRYVTQGEGGVLRLVSAVCDVLEPGQSSSSIYMSSIVSVVENMATFKTSVALGENLDYCLCVSDSARTLRSAAEKYAWINTDLKKTFKTPNYHLLVIDSVVPVMSGETMTKLLVKFKKDGDSTGEVVAMSLDSLRSVITNNGIAVFDNSNIRMANISGVADAVALVPNTIEMTLVNPISIPRGTQGQFKLKIEDTNYIIKSAEGFLKLKEPVTVSSQFQNPLIDFLNKSSQIPADGATAACPDKPITIDFDKDLDLATATTGTVASPGNIMLRTAADNLLKMVTVGVSGKRLTITPTPIAQDAIAALGLGVKYNLTVKSGDMGLKAVSPGSEPLEFDIVVNFTTKEVGCGHAGTKPIVANFSSGDSFSCMVELVEMVGIAEPARIVGCWGKNDKGQLGIGTSSAHSVFMKSIVGVSGKVFKGVKTGDGHACAFTDTKVYCWGNNSSGQLGTGTSTSSSTPSPVLGFPVPGNFISAVNIKDLALGSDSSCAVVEVVSTAQNSKPKYRLYCWGKLIKADGITDIKSFGNKAVMADTTYNWKNVFAAAQTVCAIKSDKSLWCMGKNDKGQLGNNLGDDMGVMTTVAMPLGAQTGDKIAWDKVDVNDNMICGVATITRPDVFTIKPLMCWGDSFSERNRVPVILFEDTIGITEFAVLSEGSSKSIRYIINGRLKYFKDSFHTFAQPGINWVGVDVDGERYCGIRQETTSENRLYCVGPNTYGGLGIGESDTTKASIIPMPVVKALTRQ